MMIMRSRSHRHGRALRLGPADGKGRDSPSLLQWRGVGGRDEDHHAAIFLPSGLGRVRRDGIGRAIAFDANLLRRHAPFDEFAADRCRPLAREVQIIVGAADGIRVAFISAP